MNNKSITNNSKHIQCVVEKYIEENPNFSCVSLFEAGIYYALNHPNEIALQLDSYKMLRDAVENLIRLCDNTKQHNVSELWQLRIGVVKECLALVSSAKTTGACDHHMATIVNRDGVYPVCSVCGELIKAQLPQYKFRCQVEIEGDGKCESQCEHCREYYKPIEK